MAQHADDRPSWAARCLRGLTDFWFPEPQPAVFSLATVGIALVTVLELLRMSYDLNVWFDPHLFPAHLHIGRAGGFSLNLFNYLPDGVLTARILILNALLLSVLYVFNVQRRLVAALTWIILLSLFRRTPYVLNSGHGLLLVMWFWMIFGDWARRPMQVQIVLVYFSAVGHKLIASAWIDGSAVYFVSRVNSLMRWTPPYIFDHAWTIAAMTWGTLWLQALLAAGLWNRRLRRLLIPLGLSFHILLEATLNLAVFQGAMICGLLLFLIDPQLPKYFRRHDKSPS